MEAAARRMNKMAFNRPLSSVKKKMTRNTRYSLTKELGKRYILSNLPIIISSQFSDCLFFYYYKNFHICVSLSSLQKTLQCSYTSFSQFIVSSSNKSLCLQPILLVPEISMNLCSLFQLPKSTMSNFSLTNFILYILLQGHSFQSVFFVTRTSHLIPLVSNKCIFIFYII